MIKRLNRFCVKYRVPIAGGYVGLGISASAGVYGMLLHLLVFVLFIYLDHEELMADFYREKYRELEKIAEDQSAAISLLKREIFSLRRNR